MTKNDSNDMREVADLLKTLIIIQLGLAGVPQREIRTIAGCDMNRVTDILRHFKRASKKE